MKIFLVIPVMKAKKRGKAVLMNIVRRRRSLKRELVLRIQKAGKEKETSRVMSY